jgi:tryptophan synthase alpha chain
MLTAASRRWFEDVVIVNALAFERVCVGLGVSSAEQVAEITAYADGVIVGSAVVSALHQGGVDAIASS